MNSIWIALENDSERRITTVPVPRCRSVQRMAAKFVAQPSHPGGRLWNALKFSMHILRPGEGEQ